MAGLEVEIGADNSEFKKKIAETEVDLKKLSNEKFERIKLGLDTKQVGAEIKDIKKHLNDLKTTVKDTGNSFATATPKIANGGNALMQFSRIAQDAPFGIMGIGNNITATAESFGHLKNQTGSAGGALKAIASSMMGTGGILLAVSLVTTGLTIMAQKGITVGDVFNKITGSFDEFGASLKKINDEAAKSAIEETGAIKGLISIAQNETLARKNRIAAVDELQSKYPAYFGNLTKEQVMTKDLTGTVNELSKALINRAIAAKLSEAAVEPTLKLWHANAELDKQKQKLIDTEKEYQQLAGSLHPAQAAQLYARTVYKQEKAVSAARNEVVALTKEVERYQKIIDVASEKSSSLLIKTPPKAKATKTDLGKREPQALLENFLGFDENKAKKEIDYLFSHFGNALEDFKNNKIKLEIPLQPVLDNTALFKAQETLLNFNNSLNDIINNGIGNTLSGLGEVIGNGLINGGNVLENLGASLLGSLGGILVELGKMAIATGVGLLAVKMALTSLNPAVAIAAGVALVAIGSAFSSASKSLGGSMGKGSGGASSGSTGGDYSSPSANSSYSASGSMSSGGGTVIFEIAGQKLIGVLSNTLDANSRLGGALGI